MDAPHPIRRIRRQRHITVEELAAKAGVSSATVYRAERGVHEPTRSTRERIARALGVTPGELLADIHGPEADTPSTGRGENPRDDEQTAKSRAVPAHTGV